jgi:hypothetical protein
MCFLIYSPSATRKLAFLVMLLNLSKEVNSTTQCGLRLRSRRRSAGILPAGGSPAAHVVANPP